MRIADRCTDLLADLVLPHRCPVCGRPGPSPCGPCRSAIARAPRAAPPAGVDRLAAVVAYRGEGRAVVAAVKYRGDRGPLAWLVDELAVQLPTGAPGAPTPPAAPFPAVATWVPATARHRRERGVDGAALLARALATRLGVPARRLLRRGAGPPQVGRGAADRRRGPALACPERLAGGVLVVDDVVTTGATAEAAARALRAAGASAVWFACIART